MSKYGLSDDYVIKEEEIVKGMTMEENRKIRMKYIKSCNMVYLVVGDATSQMKSLEKIGFGKPVLINLKYLGVF